MPNVSNLKIQYQSGSGGTYFASWDFNETTKNVVAATSVKSGDLVSIRSGATYYNGVAIPSWVMSQRWYVLEVRGDRAVVNENESRTNSIMSPINVAFLDNGSSSSGGGAEVSESTVDHYTVEWFYDTGDSVWFTGGSSDVTVKNATYSAPSNSIRIKVNVTPVAKTHKVNDEDVAYWTGTATEATYAMEASPPEVPPTPTVTIDKYQLTAKVENISDAKTDMIRFLVYNGTMMVRAAEVTVKTAQAVYTCPVEAGGEYRVRCCAINIYLDSKVYSDFTEYTSSIGTIPSTPEEITSCKATSETSVRLEWTTVNSADTYDIEYTTNKNYFDGSNATTTQTGIESTHYELTGLESGKEYFFRVRAVNDQGESGWSDIVSVVVGSKPTAPTTWSSSTTVISGETLILYWVHNSADGSNQKYAELELDINGVKDTETIRTDDEDDEDDRTNSYEVDTSKYTEGTTIKWRVRTAGITNQYGDWSIQRTVDIYAPPTLALSITNSNGDSIETITTFPFYIEGLAGPKTQEPIGYHVSIAANQMYRTVDNVGNFKMVNEGEEVYSQYIDTPDALLVEMTPYNVDLQNNISYTVTVIASMNSGLTATASREISVSWIDLSYEPDAEIGIDLNTYVSYIRPYCNDDDGDPVSGITLGVYRKNFDGTFTELATRLSPQDTSYVTDPHPSLDYARYRITATSTTTGAVSYYDIPAYPVKSEYVIIQWEDSWSNFGVTSGGELEQSPWSGSMLKLPYNIDVSDSNSPDVSLVEYIGRKHPVSYYGTQLGSTATWNVEIPYNDSDTLYMLRRLQTWMGDVYVREPSGSGYWANITVSFSQTHRELTIPVTFNVTRVEGGI